MNLYEINRLIDRLKEDEGNEILLGYYLAKRDELIKRINEEIKTKLYGKIIKGELNGKEISEQWINLNHAVKIAKSIILENLK